MSADRFDLSRFTRAQAGTFNVAIAELRVGRKRTHWMWFIFPQLKGLGGSQAAEFYGISGLDEASAYLEHRVLGLRLKTALDTVRSSDAPSLQALFGDPDDLKFRSSMTLFSIAANGGRFRGAIDRWCNGEPDPRTIELLRQLTTREDS